MSGYQKRGVHGQVVHLLGQRIVGGDYSPGETLEIDELARELETSRPALREALRVLAAKGLVDARPNRGTFVRERSEWNLLDPDLMRWQIGSGEDEAFLRQLDELRSIIEPASAALAASRRTDAHLETMREAFAVMSNENASGEDLLTADLLFHRTMLEAVDNDLLQRTIVVIEVGLHLRDSVVAHDTDWAPAIPLHEAVLRAVEAGDPVAAEEAMRAVLEQGREDQREVIEARKRTDETRERSLAR